MLPFLLWILFGAFVGWLASLVVTNSGTNTGRYGLLMNIGAGVLGAALGGFLFQHNMKPDIDSIGSVLTALVGAVICLALANLPRTASVR